MTQLIPYGRQDITQEDIDAVIEVLKSDFLTQGPLVPDFEAAVADYCRAAHAVAVNSATSALHVACLGLGLRAGDWLWTTPITFVASANCALYCGAKVDFVDIDPETCNISVAKLAEKLAAAQKEGCLPKIVVPVHLAGQSCDMAAIRELSLRYGFAVIEDASHAVGGRYKGEPIGNCAYSDVTVFSFHPVKIITTGEGGMALTNDPVIASRMQLFRSHGITRDSEAMAKSPDGPWYYEQIELGYNYRMTELQAALGLSQLSRMDGYIERRHEIAQHYDMNLSKLAIRIPVNIPDAYSALHLYVIRLIGDQVAARKIAVFNKLRDLKIGVNLHYIPVHTQPYYQKLGFRKGDFPEAERYYDQAITIPLYPTMDAQSVDRVVAAVNEAVA